MTAEEMKPFLADVDVIILGSTWCSGSDPVPKKTWMERGRERETARVSVCV